jgi:pimeloyl-ACP methyl ester carboxylesterase
MLHVLTVAGALLALPEVTACGESPDAALDPALDPIPDASWEASPDASAEDELADASVADKPDAAEVPERAVEVFELGTGDATVVFEAGLGDDWTSWEGVARDVAAKARVFAYSRPGYGESEPTAEPRDPAHIVEALRSLLAARGYAPPYLLVGHSFGGVYMELFAKAYPEEVVGVVLVDPRHRDFSSACDEADLEGCDIPAAILSTLPQVQIDEIEAFMHASEQVRDAGAFGPYPVRVLTATAHGFGPEVEQLWQSLLGSLAGEADDGERRIFEGAGHYLQLEQPDEVAAVILSLIPSD